MGLQRIVIDTYNATDVAVAAAQEAVAAAKALGCSVSSAVVIEHPGQADEQTHEVYK